MGDVAATPLFFCNKFRKSQQQPFLQNRQIFLNRFPDNFQINLFCSHAKTQRRWGQGADGGASSAPPGEIGLLINPSP